jgi:adenosylhomocysteine nucleosidase
MKIVVLISANAEWRSVKPLFPQAALQTSPFGEWFDGLVGAQQVTFFFGGWGKISAAATAQYVIDHFQPDLMINLGTCGGFAGCIETGTLILVERTVVYDIIEQMGDPDEAIQHYASHIDLSWLPDGLPGTYRRDVLVSADRDILLDDIPMLRSRYGAVAADWESGAIAWVAQKNRVRCLILRGVSDVVGSTGGEAYGDYALFAQRSEEIMKNLLSLLQSWMVMLPAAASPSRG